MAKEPSEEQIYEEARKRVKDKKRFYSGLATYAVVNAVLVVIWALSGRGYPWFLGRWGFGVSFYSETFSAPLFLSKGPMTRPSRRKLRR